MATPSPVGKISFDLEEAALNAGHLAMALKRNESLRS
jgi:hypothetical protein